MDLIDESRVSPNEPNYAANTEEWEVVSEQDFLNAGKSDPLFRAFYIPFLSGQYTEYNRYVFLQRKKRNVKRNKSRHAGGKKAGKEFSDDLEDDF